ncbi:hypothetical protein [Clostridium sp. BJN0013]|uniref:hypothetical protein n=1 Tax=Clostridium sp. BJN0013 TaxID=3236840 RepID=UPI0034C5CFD5
MILIVAVLLFYIYLLQLQTKISSPPCHGAARVHSKSGVDAFFLYGGELVFYAGIPEYGVWCVFAFWRFDFLHISTNLLSDVVCGLHSLCRCGSFLEDALPYQRAGHRFVRNYGVLPCSSERYSDVQQCFWGLVSESSHDGFCASAVSLFLTDNLLIAEAKEIEQKVTTEKEALASLNRMKIEFLGNVSHELKMPLVVISSYAQTTRQLVERSGEIYLE